MTTKNLLVRGGADFSGIKKEMEKTQKQIENFQVNVTSAMKKVGIALASIGLGKMIKDSISAASELEGAFLGLQSIIEGQGRSFSKAKGFINEYINDGLVPLTDAVTAYKNLAARGYNDEQIQQTMNRLKDAAAFGRQSGLTLGEAVATATEGLKNENSVLVDNAGVTKNVAKMWDEYAKSIGTTANNLTQQQKIQAEVNGIMSETQFQVGDAAKYTDTYAGRLAYLNKTLGDIQVNIGQAFMPIANFVLPILQKLANWLSTVTAYIKYFMQALFGVKSAQSQVSAAVGGATVAQEEYGNATEGAGNKVKKAAKEAKGSLAGFDEINSLADTAKADGDSSDSGGGGTGGSGGADIDIPDFDLPEIDTETIPAKIQELVDKIKESFKGIWDGAKDLGSKFADAFSGIGPALQPIRDAVEPIKQSFRDIGQTFMQLLDEFLKPAASYILFDFIPSIVTGFVKDFAPVFADAAVWGMNLLAQTFQNVTDLIIASWNEVWLPSLELIKVAWMEASTSIATSLQSLLDGTIKPLTDFLLNQFILPIVDQLNRVLVPILTDVLVFALQLFAKTFENVTNTLNELTSKVIIPALERIRDAFLNFLPRIGDALQTLLDGTIKPFADYILNGFAIPIADAIIKTVVPIFTDVLVTAFEIAADAFEWAANLMNDIYKSVIKPTFDLVKKIITDTLKIITDAWDKHGKDLLKNLKDLFKNIQDTFQSLWDKVLKPIVEPFLEKLTWLWDKHLKGVVDEVVKFVLKLVDAALDILNKFILPVIKFLVDDLGPTFSTIFNFVADVVGTTVAVIADIIKGLLQILGGLIDFIVGVFTGNWGKAWDGVVSVFDGIVTLIAGIFKGVLNLTIDVINSAIGLIIDGINRVVRSAMEIVSLIPGIDIKFNPITPPRIPKLARGGIVDGATNFGNYIAGEAGAEMIVPLENTPFVDKLASALGTAVMAAMSMNNNQSGSNQGDFVLNVDGTTLARILNPYLAKEGQRLGSAIIQPI